MDIIDGSPLIWNFSLKNAFHVSGIGCTPNSAYLNLARKYGFSGYIWTTFFLDFGYMALKKYGIFAYMDHFSRDKLGPYIRN